MERVYNGIGDVNELLLKNGCIDIDALIAI